MKKIKKIIGKSGYLLALAGLLLSFTAQVSAQADLYKQLETPFYDPNSGISCQPGSGGGTSLGSPNNVYFVGDSIGHRIETTLQSDITSSGAKFSSDTLDSRNLSGTPPAPDGLSAVQQDKKAVAAADTVVVELGTNTAGFSAANVDKMIKEIQTINTNAVIYWVDTVVVGRPSYAKALDQVNSVIYAKSIGDSFQVIPWNKAVLGNSADPTNIDPNAKDTNGYIDNSDGLGVHPTIAKGVPALASLISSAINRSNSSNNNNACSCEPGQAVGGGANTDYAGRSILNQTQLQAIQQNQPIYQQAAQQAGIPWQVLAAIHYRETNLSLVAPSNGDGQYQIVSKSYPSSGTISQQEFFQESIDAANFLKHDGGGLTDNSGASVIKDTMGRYNGLPPLYEQQAVYLGFTSNQAYEGSPYVMNMADARRDPHISSVVSSGHWDQYETPTLVVPANTNFYGAFVVYASLSGQLTSGGGCTPTIQCNGPNNATVGLSQVRQNIVCVADQELRLWNTKQRLPGTGYKDYSEQRPEDWCADFASWVYNQAGYPLGPAGSNTNNWNVPYVPNLQVPPQDSSKFTYHSVSGYTPQPGDLAIHGSHHVNIVTGVSGSLMTLVGGNQGSNDFNQSVVSSYQTDFTDGGDITGFVSPK